MWVMLSGEWGLHVLSLVCGKLVPGGKSFAYREFAGVVL
jgi:hypothetical protein